MGEPLEGHELVRREEIRANPPDILLTNYKQLEFLLDRKLDRTLFTNGRGIQVNYSPNDIYRAIREFRPKLMDSVQMVRGVWWFVACWLATIKSEPQRFRSCFSLGKFRFS